MIATYIPRHDSLAGCMLRFFAANREESLDIEAIVAKFDVPRGNIHMQLGQCVEHELLKRSKNDDGEYIYSIGANPSGKPKKVDISKMKLGAIEPVPAAAVPTPAKKRAVLPAAAAVVIDSHIPIPIRGGRAKQHDWLPLLAKLKKGESFALPESGRPTLSNDVTRAHKAKLGTYTLRHFKETQQVRVWRTA